ncbi:MAG: AAA family ATPase, partial [Bacilli bacterium]
MKLRSLSLHNVGKHNGMVLDNLPDGMTIVFGPNEAGKSTILAGLRGVLFGKAIIAENTTLLGQAARGAVTFELEGEQGLWRLERALTTAGRSRPLLTTPSGETHAGDPAIREMVSVLGLVEDLIYRSVFTFQLAELEGIEQLNQSLHRRIYTVGMLGSHSPVEIEQAFTAKARDIFSSDGRARNAKLRQCLTKLAEARSQEASRSDTPEAYMDLTKKLALARDSLTRDIRTREIEIDARRSRARQDVALHPIHQRIVMLTETLEPFAAMPRITSAQREIVSATAAAVEQVERQLNKDVEAYEADRREYARIVVDQRLLSLTADLQTFNRQSSGVEEQLRHIAARELELGELRRAAGSLRGQMSAQLSDEIVSNADFSSVTIDAAKRFQDRLQTAAMARDKAAQELNRNRELAALAKNGLPDSWQAESIADLERQGAQLEMDFKTLENDAAVLSELRDRAAALERLRSERDGREKYCAVLLEHSNSGRGAALAGLTVASGLLVTLGIAALLRNAMLAGFGTIVVGLALLVGGVVWVRRMLPQAAVAAVAEARRELARCDRDLELLDADIENLQKALAHVTVVPVGASELVQAQTELAAMTRSLETQREKWERLQRQHIQWQAQEDALRRAEQAQQRATQDYEELCGEWRLFLEGLELHGFACAVQPFMEQAQLVQQWRENRNTIAFKQRAQKDDANRVRDYISSVRRGLAQLSEAAGEGEETAGGGGKTAGEEGKTADVKATISDWRELDAAFTRLKTQLELTLDAALGAQEADRTRRSLQGKLTESERAVEAHRSALRSQEERRLQVFATLGIATREEFDRLDMANLDRDRLEKELQGERMGAYGICGGPDAYEARAKTLSGVAQEDLDAALVSAEADWRQCRKEEEACIQDITTL